MPEPGTWDPGDFVRFERALRTSTKPAIVVMQRGKAIIKAMNNPMSAQVLAREWVGTKLADWFGLPILDCAIYEIKEEDEIRMNENIFAATGPAFCARYIKGFTWGSDAEELKNVENINLVTKLVVFDTWTRNRDRFPPEGVDWPPRYDNVFFTSEMASPGKLKFVVLDYSECFADSNHYLDTDINSPHFVNDEKIYGLFPEFIEYVTPTAVREAIARLNEMTDYEAGRLVDGIPDEWEVTWESRIALANFIKRRATYLASNILERLAGLCWPGELTLD